MDYTQPETWLNSSSQMTANNADYTKPEAWLPQVSATDPWSGFSQKGTEIAKERNFPSNVLLSQAALESAHGTSNFAKDRNNYFGIQAYDSNPDAAAHYQTPEENINAYINLVTSYPGVKEAIASGSSDAVIKAIKAAGYATDPNYVSKIESLPEFGRNN